MAHNFDISKLTGRLQQLAYGADADKSGKIDTESEYSVFASIADADYRAGNIAEDDYKNIFGFVPTTEVKEEVVVEAPGASKTPATTNPQTTTTPVVAVSKKEAKRDEAKIKDAVKDLVKQGVTPQEIINELRTNYSNPQFATIINEVQDVLNIVNATNYNSKDDVKNIHKTAKEALKKAGKWDGFHKDVLAALEDQAEANQINKEFKVLLGKYNDVKTPCDKQGLAPNFSEYVKIAKEDVEKELEAKAKNEKKSVKELKSYTKQALEQLEDWARKEAMSVSEDRLEASQSTSKRAIRKELRAQNTANDSYQNDAIQDLKTERKIFARKNKAQNRGDELSHLNKESLISELGKRGYQYNFCRKAVAHRIGRNIYDKLKNKYLETVKNEDGTYDLSKLQADLLNYVGQDYKVNQSKDKQMSEMFNIKVRLKDLTGEDFSDNETKVLLNALGFDREHKDHLPKLGKAIVSGIGGAIAGFSSVGEIRQTQDVTVKIDKGSLDKLTSQLKQQGVNFTTTDLTKGNVALQIHQEQIVRPGVINALKGAGIGVLTSAMLDIILGNERDEKSCFSVSDYNKDDPTYTDPEKYKKHFANTTKNKAKAEAMSTLVDAYVEKYGKDKWHSELHNTILKTAGIGSKMNPEECRVLRFQKPVDKTPVNKPEPKPEPKQEPEPEPTTPAPKKDCEDSKWESGIPYVKKAGHTWENVIRAYYPDCFANTPSAEFYDVKVRRNGKIVVLKEGIITKFKKALSIDANGNFDKAKYHELRRNGDLPGKDSKGNDTYFPSEFLGCQVNKDADPLRTKIKKGRMSKRYSAGSRVFEGENCYTNTPVRGATAKERDEKLNEARRKATK